MIERTPSRRMPQRHGWLAVAAMLALALMPALSRLDVDRAVSSVRLPMVLCLAWPSARPIGDTPPDAPAPAAADAGCPFCATGHQPVLPSAIRGWQPLSSSGDQAPADVVRAGPTADRRGPVRVRGPPLGGPMRPALPVGERHDPNALAA